MDQAINKLYNWNPAVGIKHLFIFALLLLSCIPVHVTGQNSCDAYDEIFDESVLNLFTSERDRITRESAFPPEFHQSLQTQKIRRLNFPEEQWVCDAVLEAIPGNEPHPGPPTHRALYMIKDHYFLVVYKYYTDVQGNQMIEEPTVGGLFDPEFNLVGLIVM